MVLAVMGVHATFAVWLPSRAGPIASPFFASLRLPYVPDLLAGQRRGAVLAWMRGEVPTLIAVVVLVRHWTRTERADATTRSSPSRSRADRTGGSAESEPPDRCCCQKKTPA